MFKSSSSRAVYMSKATAAGMEAPTLTGLPQFEETPAASPPPAATTAVAPDPSSGQHQRAEPEGSPYGPAERPKPKPKLAQGAKPSGAPAPATAGPAAPERDRAEADPKGAKSAPRKPTVSAAALGAIFDRVAQSCATAEAAEAAGNPAEAGGQEGVQTAEDEAVQGLEELAKKKVTRGVLATTGLGKKVAQISKKNRNVRISEAAAKVVAAWRVCVDVAS